MTVTKALLFDGCGVESFVQRMERVNARRVDVHVRLWGRQGAPNFQLGTNCWLSRLWLLPPASQRAMPMTKAVRAGKPSDKYEVMYRACSPILRCDGDSSPQ